MTDSPPRLFRLCLWLTLLFAVSLAAQSVVVAHQARIRGLPSGFPAPVAGAGVPILGVNVALEQYDNEELETALTRIAKGGFVWVRQSFTWSQIEPEPGRFDWTVPDRIMAALARHPGLRLVAVLDDSPHIPPAEPDRFAAFAHAFAARYGAQVDDYQVWDEPNLADHWGGGPANPPAYADLLARTARAIRAADTNARIILAGLAPTVETGPQNLSDVRYLEQLYQAGAAPYFDVVAGKPYGFYTGPDDRRADEAVLNFARLLLLREVMVAHGDAGKAVWASHWGWNALPLGWMGAPSAWGQTDETTQAVRTVAALERARAEWPWAGALILDHFQPFAAPGDPRWGFALVGPDFAPRPVYDAVAAWAAALPDAAPAGGYPALNPWATYEGGWRVGPLGADAGRPTVSDTTAGGYPALLATGSDGDRATFRFAGSAVALTVRRGPYRAFLYVTVDGEPANGLPRDEVGRAYVVLYDRTPSVATVPLATALPPGPHTVEVVAEGGQGQWALADWRVGVEPVYDGYSWKVAGLVVAGLALAALLVRDARRVEWTTLGQTFLSWPEWAQVALIAGLTGLLWATAGASWGRDLSPASCFPPPASCFLLPASCFLLSLLVLPVLASLLTLRLDLGLALVACAAPFYLHPGDMLYRALSLPEVLVVLCGVGAVVRAAMRSSRGAEETGGRGDKETGGQGDKETGRQGDGETGGQGDGETGGQGDKETGGQGDGETGGQGDRETGRQGDGEARGHGNRKGGRVALTPLDWAVLLVVLAAGVAGLVAVDRWAALFELRAVFLLPALYYLLLRLARPGGSAELALSPSTLLGMNSVKGLAEAGRARWRIVDGLVLGATGVAVIGLAQYALGRNLVVAEGGLPRLQSVYYSPNNVGLYLGRVWPLLVAVALWGGRGHRRTLYGLALVVVTLALVLSFSRGALLLGLPASVLAMGWLAGAGLSSARRYRWLALALVLAGVLALVPLLRLPRFASLLDLQEGSTFFRLELWRSSLALIREHPWFGVGPGNFQATYRSRYVLPSAWQEFNLEHPHNVYLDHWTRLGLLGLLAVVAVQVVFWRALLQCHREYSWRRSKPSPPRASWAETSRQRQPPAAQQAPATGALSISLGLVGSMAGLLAHGLVDNTLFFPDLALIFFLTLALVQWTVSVPLPSREGTGEGEPLESQLVLSP